MAEFQATTDRVREILNDERFKDRRNVERPALIRELHSLEKTLADAGFDGAFDPRLAEDDGPSPKSFGTFA